MLHSRVVTPPSRHCASGNADRSDESESRSKSTCAQLKSASIHLRDSAEPRSRSSSLRPCRGSAHCGGQPRYGPLAGAGLRTLSNALNSAGRHTFCTPHCPPSFAATALCCVAIDPRGSNTFAVSKCMKIEEEGDTIAVPPPSITGIPAIPEIPENRSSGRRTVSRI
jgi:hypothetical protein